MIPYEPMKLQEEILKFWIKNRIPQRIVDFNPEKKKFYLLDGPPYVNGVPHVGHVKTTTAKDIWSKFRTMQGFQAWWQPGFDCGGLPIENAVEKKLKIKSKKDIENVIGLDRFIGECKKMAEGNKDIWLEVYKKLGAWRGWVDPYMTYKNYYLESGWWTVKKLYEKGFFIEGHRPGYWCPHCETVLTGYEVTDSYADLEDVSIFVKFPLKGKKNEYFLVWTTTPWTLPANAAIAVHPDETYVRAEVGGEVLILAEKRLEIFQDMGIGYKIMEKFKGKKLEGVSYNPVLDVPVQKTLEKEKNARKVIVSIPIMKQRVSSKAAIKSGTTETDQFGHIVTMDMGSGLVHIAPGHGDVDNKIGKHYGIPELSPVDEEGKLTEDVGEFGGIYVKEADKKIIEHLKKSGLLLKAEKITHSYPLCWRCKSPLIFRMSKQWYLKVDMIKDKMINENKFVKWNPPFAKNRMNHMLTDAPDWAITRQRYWGIPTPVWICDKCGTRKVIGSLSELKKHAIEEVGKDLHKNSVDKIHLRCECGSKMTRVPDIMDVWFDSGISPWASLGYPVENKELFERLWPVDMVCEGQDHIRGWFYALLFMGTSTFDMSPFKGVSMTGWTLDDKGEKMSKSLGNVVYAEDALKDLEADTLRYYYCWNISPWETQNFNLRIAKELRRVLSVLWNSAIFTRSYSDPGMANRKLKSNDLETEDRWIISRLNSLVGKATRDLENFRLHYVGRDLGDFILNDFSRWYIKIIRNRLSPWYEGKDKEAAQFTMMYVLDNLIRIMAPITPFITEKIYQLVFSKKKGSPESIHLCTWPETDKVMVNKDLEKKMDIAREIVEGINSLRQREKVKSRWPVSTVLFRPKDKETAKAAEDLSRIIMIMGNSEGFEIAGQIPKKGKKSFERGSLCLGEVLTDKAFVRELSRKIQILRKKEKLKVDEKIELCLSSDRKTEGLIKKFEKEVKNNVGASSIHLGKKEQEKGALEFKGMKVSVSFRKKK